MAGLIKSLRLFFSKEKKIKVKRPGGILTYKEFSLKGIKKLTIKGSLCQKDIIRIVDIIKTYRKLEELDLKEVSSILDIQDNLFHGCESLRKIVLPTSTIRIGESAFEACKCLSDVIMPDGLKTIGKSAFFGCNSLKEITIPQNVKSIGSWAFVCKHLNTIHVSIHNDFFTSIDGIVYSSDKKCLVKCPTNTCADVLKIQSEVETINEGAFMDCNDIKEVLLPSSIKTIEDRAFYNSSIRTIKLPVGITKIGKMTFSQCNNLESIEIPGTVKQIGDRAFATCNRLKKVVINDGVCGIGDNVFVECANITEIKLPDSALNN